MQKNIKYVQSEWVTAAVLNFLYCILFLEHTKETNKALISKTVLVTNCRN